MSGSAVGSSAVPDEVLVPLPEPPQMPARRGSDLLTGLTMLPEQVLMAMSPSQLEQVVPHWLHEAVGTRYARVRRLGSAGDRGRDVVAFYHPTAPDPWDCYQCKRYTEQLTLSDIWPELGKLVYWVREGAYKAPSRYVFVCPKGMSVPSWDLLQDHDGLRVRLAEQWDKDATCRRLSAYDDIKDALSSFAFPDFDTAPAERIVSDLKGTAIYSVLFGGGLAKPRPADVAPPDDIDPTEIAYVQRLVEAYDEHEAAAGISRAEDALAHAKFGDHLRRSRRAFYCAESLREFSKDVLAPPDDFSTLRDEVHDGVAPTLAMPYGSGFDRVLAVTEQATRIVLSDHPLREVVRSNDRIGMCHQLANDGLVHWRIK